MSTVVRFLEKMGKNAELRQATRPALHSALGAQGVEAEFQWAILRGDVEGLARRIGAPTIACAELSLAEYCPYGVRRSLSTAAV